MILSRKGALWAIMNKYPETYNKIDLQVFLQALKEQYRRNTVSVQNGVHVEGKIVGASRDILNDNDEVYTLRLPLAMLLPYLLKTKHSLIPPIAPAHKDGFWPIGNPDHQWF